MSSGPSSRSSTGHDLRHTAATLLLVQGVHLKAVSEMLRHASVSIMLDLYYRVHMHSCRIGMAVNH
jgi:integrase